MDGFVQLGIPITKIDRRGPLYKKSDVDHFVMKEAALGQHAAGRLKTMTKEIETAIDDIEVAKKQFVEILDKTVSMQQKCSESIKKVSGNVRASANELATGLLKIQKTADFASLERHVTLLERAAAALTTLAELEKAGKLEKIIGAVK